MPEDTRENSDDNLDDLPVVAARQQPDKIPAPPPAVATSEPIPSDSIEKAAENTETELIRRHMFAPDSTRLIETEKAKWLLMAIKDWTLLDNDIRAIIEPGILQFIDRNPVPGNEEIKAQIAAEAKLADSKMIIRRVFAIRGQDIPDEIKNALFAEAEQTINDNNHMTDSEIQDYGNMLVREAHAHIERAKSDGSLEISGLKIIIAADIIRATRKRIYNMQETTPQTFSGIRVKREPPPLADTIPGTPDAKAGKRKSG